MDAYLEHAISYFRRLHLRKRQQLLRLESVRILELDSEHFCLSGKGLDTLNRQTFFGMELKPLTYLLGIMNMILHRIEGANL